MPAITASLRRFRHAACHFVSAFDNCRHTYAAALRLIISSGRYMSVDDAAFIFRRYADFRQDAAFARAAFLRAIDITLVAPQRFSRARRVGRHATFIADGRYAHTSFAATLFLRLRYAADDADFAAAVTAIAALMIIRVTTFNMSRYAAPVDYARDEREDVICLHTHAG